MEVLRKKLSSTLKEGIIAKLSPSSSTESHETSQIPHIRLAGGERIIESQRQHWIVLLFPLAVIFSILAISFALFGFLLYQNLIEIPLIILLDFALLIIAFLFTYAIFSFMYWYYQFYIITNKCVFHRHFFRLGGYYSEEVFLETSPEREIVRQSPNPIFGFLELDDIYVYFQRPGLEIFVFRLPRDAQRIEDALETVTIGSLKK